MRLGIRRATGRVGDNRRGTLMYWRTFRAREKKPQTQKPRPLRATRPVRYNRLQQTQHKFACSTRQKIVKRGTRCSTTAEPRPVSSRTSNSSGTTAESGGQIYDIAPGGLHWQRQDGSPRRANLRPSHAGIATERSIRENVLREIYIGHQKTDRSGLVPDRPPAIIWGHGAETPCGRFRKNSLDLTWHSSRRPACSTRRVLPKAADPNWAVKDVWSIGEARSDQRRLRRGLRHCRSDSRRTKIRLLAGSMEGVPATRIRSAAGLVRRWGRRLGFRFQGFGS